MGCVRKQEKSLTCDQGQVKWRRRETLDLGLTWLISQADEHMSCFYVPFSMGSMAPRLHPGHLAGDVHHLY